MRGALLLVLLVLSPVALAQDPGDSVTLTVTPGVTSVAVGVDDPGAFDVEVSFDSTNPLDDVQERTILVDLEGIPDGWTASVEPAHFNTANHAKTTVAITVSVSPDASAEDFDVVVTAHLLPRGADGLPQVGGQVEPDETASDSVNVLRKDPLTREALETVGAWLWLLLAGAVVLAVVAAKLVYDTRRTAVKLHATTTQVTVAAGGRIAVPLRVENVTRVEDTVVFHVAPMPDGWAAHLPVPELDLDGHQSEELHLIIRAPSDAPPGSQETVGVSAHSAQAPKRAAELVVTATVSEGQ